MPGLDISGARRRLAMAAVATTAAISLTLPAHAAAGTGYAALGDSYTSGPLIPDQTAGVPGCLRSDHNYPHVTAASLGLTLADMSCSGATTADLTAPQQTNVGTNPAQLAGVADNDAVVTVQIGGNDIGFINIVRNCAAATPFGPTGVGPTCQAYYTSGGTDRISVAIARTAPKITAVLARVHQAAPKARVFVVGYPAILPDTGAGCWPQMPFTYTDAPYLRAKEIELDRMLASVAAGDGDTYVDTYSPSVAHSACSSEDVRWVEPLVPAALAAPVHPNAAGETAMAGLVTAAIRSVRPAGPACLALTGGRPYKSHLTCQ